MTRTDNYRIEYADTRGAWHRRRGGFDTASAAMRTARGNYGAGWRILDAAGNTVADSSRDADRIERQAQSAPMASLARTAALISQVRREDAAMAPVCADGCHPADCPHSGREVPTAVDAAPIEDADRGWLARSNASRDAAGRLPADNGYQAPTAAPIEDADREAPAHWSDSDPCDCGTVRGASGFYLAHAAGAHPDCEDAAPTWYACADCGAPTAIGDDCAHAGADCAASLAIRDADRTESDAPAAPIEASGAIEDAAAYLAVAVGDSAVTIAETAATVDWCRDWASDCDWQDADREDIAAMAPLALLRSAHRSLDGGLATALEDCRRLALDTVPLAAWQDRRERMAQDADREAQAIAHRTATGAALLAADADRTAGAYLAPAPVSDADRYRIGRAIEAMREARDTDAAAQDAASGADCGAPTAAAILAEPIEACELGVRAYNVAKRRGIDTCGALLAVTAQDANDWAREDARYTIGTAGARQIADAQSLIRRELVGAMARDADADRDAIELALVDGRRIAAGLAPLAPVAPAALDTFAPRAAWQYRSGDYAAVPIADAYLVDAYREDGYREDGACEAWHRSQALSAAVDAALWRRGAVPIEAPADGIEDAASGTASADRGAHNV